MIEDFPLGPSGILLLFYVFCAAFPIIGTIVYFLFASLNAAEWMTAGAILLLSLFIFGVLRLLKLLMDHLHTKFEIGELRRNKNNLFIGFGGMAICGWIPRITVYFIATDIPVIWCCVLISIMTIFLFYVEFIGLDDTWDINFEKQKRFINYSIVAHVIALWLTLRIGCTYYTTENGKLPVTYCQFWFSFICASSMTELCLVLMGDQNQRRAQNTGNNRITQNAKNSETSTLETPQMAGTAKTEFVYPRIECEICLLEYNDTSRIPRILKECGHTVCQNCADNLLKQNKGKLIFCPFCQNATVVNGPANLLPKNYTVLGLIQDRKNN